MLLLILTLPILSQNTKVTDSVSISVKALKSMYKESLKHDNLKVAYEIQYSTLQDLANSNLKYFAEIQAIVIKRDALHIELNNAIESLRKKKSNW